MDYLQEEADKKKKSVASWLEDTIKNADKCTWCTHVGKFVHPSVENVAIFVPYRSFSRIGAVFTENTVCESDVAVSANYLATAKLLALELEDGRSLLEHFRDDSEQIRRDLSSLGVNYGKVRDEALKAKEGELPADTDDRLRQIFFPLGDGGYHLLSILPSSSLMMAVRTRVQAIEQKGREARDEKTDNYGQKHQRLPNMVCIGVGGTKPQNISYLNNKYGGKTYMFLSLPPKIEKRDVTRPRKDFFKETLRRWQFGDLFQILHARYIREQNNLETRKNTRATEEHIIDKVLAYADRLRALPKGWTDGKNVALPKAQKLWLDEQYAEQRDAETEWKQEISDALAQWILRSYEKVMKDKAVALSTTEKSFLQQEILQAL